MISNFLFYFWNQSKKSSKEKIQIEKLADLVIAEKMKTLSDPVMKNHVPSESAFVFRGSIIRTVLHNELASHSKTSGKMNSR